MDDFSLEQFDKEQIFEICVQNGWDGWILLSGDEVQAYNSRAARLLGIHSKEKVSFSELLGAENVRKFQEKGCVIGDLNGRYLRLRSFLQMDGRLLIRVIDISPIGNFMDSIRRLTNTNEKLKNFLETYSENTLYICDGGGHTLYAGDDVAYNCGVTEEYLKAHTVMELERERIFYPSVSMRVMKSKKVEVVTQITDTGTTGIAMGIPVLDADGQLTSIISFTRNLPKTLEWGKIFTEMYGTDQSEDQRFEGFIACSPASLQLQRQINSIASLPVDVLVMGEPGSGRDVVVTTIHKLESFERARFEKIDCREWSERKIERLLFGEKGKPGLLSDRFHGIVYLDEIGCLTMRVQKRLSSFLEKKRPHTRLRCIFSADASLAKRVLDGSFLSKLYEQITAVTLTIPPLRERREDIPLFIRQFVNEYHKEYGIKKDFSEEAVMAMEDYDWPGNVLQLRRTVRQILALSEKLQIDVGDLPVEISKIQGEIPENEAHALPAAVARLEKRMIENALKQYGNTTDAARALGINQSTISRKMKKYGIESRKNNAQEQ